MVKLPLKKRGWVSYLTGSVSEAQFPELRTTLLLLLPDRLGVVVPLMNTFMDQNGLFRIYLYLIGPCAKKENLGKQLLKYLDKNV